MAMPDIANRVGMIEEKSTIHYYRQKNKGSQALISLSYYSSVKVKITLPHAS